MALLVNAKRWEFHSQYLQNEEALKVKAQLARRVLQPPEKRPTNLDLSLLENYANARQISLEDAAKAILVLLENAGRVLVETEKFKDDLLAKIEALSCAFEVDDINAFVARQLEV